MKLMNVAKRFGAVVVGGVVAAPVFASGESGLSSTETLAVIADAKIVLLAIVVAAAGALIALKWGKKLTHAA